MRKWSKESKQKWFERSDEAFTHNMNFNVICLGFIIGFKNYYKRNCFFNFQNVTKS